MKFLHVVLKLLLATKFCLLHLARPYGLLLKFFQQKLTRIIFGERDIIRCKECM